MAKKASARPPSCNHRYEIRVLAGAIRDVATLVERIMDFEKSRTTMGQYAAVHDRVREIQERISVL